jgi:hypothetical protein
VDPSLSLLDSRLEEPVEQSDRIEHLERTRVNHGGTVPVHRPGVLVDEAAADAPTAELG